MTGRNSAVSFGSPPKPPSKSRRRFPRLRRLKLHQYPAETLHIRRLDNGLARPCGRSGENLGHFSSLVGAVVFAKPHTFNESEDDERKMFMHRVFYSLQCGAD